MNVSNKVKLKHIYLAISIIFICSVLISFKHFSPFHESFGKWILMTLSIMSGFLFFAIVCLIEGVFLKALPVILLGISVPTFIFLWYLKKGNKVALILSSIVWLLEGYMATIGAWF